MPESSERKDGFLTCSGCRSGSFLDDRYPKPSSGTSLSTGYEATLSELRRPFPSTSSSAVSWSMANRMYGESSTPGVGGPRSTPSGSSRRLLLEDRTGGFSISKTGGGALGTSLSVFIGLAGSVASDSRFSWLVSGDLFCDGGVPQ